MVDETPGSNDWDADDYDDYDDDHSFVYEYGSDVLELLAPESGERILDLGCGTGHLTGRIAATGATAVGVDGAPEMIDRARETHPEPTFVRADARRMSFDAVFSNAALDPRRRTGRRPLVGSGRAPSRRPVRRRTRGDGKRRTDRRRDGRGTRDPRLRHRTPVVFPERRRVRQSARGSRLRSPPRAAVRSTELEDGEAGLRNWLELFGDSLFEPLSADEGAAVIEAVEDRLEPALYDDDDDTWTADYRRLRFRAVSG